MSGWQIFLLFGGICSILNAILIVAPVNFLAALGIVCYIIASMIVISKEDAASNGSISMNCISSQAPQALRLIDDIMRELVDRYQVPLEEDDHMQVLW